jgi:hypothetical protein
MLVNLLLKNQSSERTFLTNDEIKIGNIIQYYLETFNICYLDNTQNLPIVFKRNRNDNEFILLSCEILNNNIKRLIRYNNIGYTSDENVICQLELPMINKINYWQGYINFISNNSIISDGLIGMSYIANGSIRQLGRTQTDMIRNYGTIQRVNSENYSRNNFFRRNNTERPNLQRTNIEPVNTFESYFTNQTLFNPTNIINSIIPQINQSNETHQSNETIQSNETNRFNEINRSNETTQSRQLRQPRMEFQFVRSNGISNLENLFGGGLIRNILSNITNLGTDIRVVLSEQTFNTLRKCKYEQLENNLKEMNNLCNLTLQEFLPNNDVVVLPCNHVFNYEPIKEWLTIHSNKCPVCRQEIEGPRRYVNEDNEDIVE